MPAPCSVALLPSIVTWLTRTINRVFHDAPFSRTRSFVTIIVRVSAAETGDPIVAKPASRQPKKRPDWRTRPCRRR